MINGRSLMTAFLATTGIAGLASPAIAQDSPTASAAQPAAEGASSPMDEIVVTAQKRRENLQAVAITAISGKQLDLQGVSDIHALNGFAPNVAIAQGTTGPNAAVVTIRGIPSPADESFGIDSPIGVYIDGVYLARSAASSLEVADIDHVEVLRGPQGTLFGRNTTGGAINFITKLPDSDSNVQARLGYGNFDQIEGRLLFNTGTIGEALRLSFGYQHKQRDGVVDNLLASSSSDPGSYKTDGGRFAATLDLTSNIKLTNIFDYTRTRSVPSASQLVAVGDGTVLPNVTIDGHVFAPTQPANVAGYLADATSLNPGCGKPVSESRINPICLDRTTKFTDTNFGNLFRIEADLSEATIRTTTAYRQWHEENPGSNLDGLGTLSAPAFTSATLFNGLPASLLSLIPTIPAAAVSAISGAAVPTTTQPLFYTLNDRKQHQVSQEIEIVSKTEGSFEWVVGGFFFREVASENNRQSSGFVLDTNQDLLG